METPIKALKSPERDFGTVVQSERPRQPQQEMMQETPIQVPSNQGQGMSVPMKMREFFGASDADYISAMIVFVLILALSDKFLPSLFKHVPGLSFMFGADGNIGYGGSCLFAVLGAVIFFLIVNFALNRGS